MLPAELEWVNTRLNRNHFAKWMGPSVVSAADGEVEIDAPWREEVISNPDLRFTHGGILATLVGYGCVLCDCDTSWTPSLNHRQACRLSQHRKTG